MLGTHFYCRLDQGKEAASTTAKLQLQTSWILYSVWHINLFINQDIYQRVSTLKLQVHDNIVNRVVQKSYKVSQFMTISNKVFKIAVLVNYFPSKSWLCQITFYFFTIFIELKFFKIFLKKDNVLELTFVYCSNDNLQALLRNKQEII